MRSRRLILIIPLLVGLGAAARAATPIVDVGVQPDFLGQPNSALETYKADLSNLTDQVEDGVITVQPTGTDYPFSLAPYQKKSIFLYHMFTNYSDWNWEMQCHQRGSTINRVLSSTVRVETAGAESRVLTIGRLGQSVGWAFGQNNLDKAYSCLVENAPPRSIAYMPFQAVLLSDYAARRVSPSVAAALKQYTLAGGTLLFGHVPGAGPFAGFAPSNGQTKPLGLGTVRTLAFDPCSGDVGNKSLAAATFTAAVPQNPGPLATDEPRLNNYEAVQVGTRPTANDPFATRLPPFATVATVAVLYFLAVVPLNFFLLRKLRRPELTWLSAPILAIVFGGVAFGSSRGLYKDVSSNATRGTLFVQEGLPEALFVGESDVFLQHSGPTSLNLNSPTVQTEYVDDRTTFSGEMMSAAMQMPPSPGLTSAVDDGLSVDDPRYQAKNLELKEVGLIQQIDAGGWFAFSQRREGDGFIAMSVKNLSPYPVKGAKLFAGDTSSPIRDLLPGKTLTFLTGPTPEIPASPNPGMVDVSTLAAQDHRVILSGKIDQLPVGANVGRRVEARTDIALMVFARPQLRLPYLPSPPASQSVVSGGPPPGAPPTSAPPGAFFPSPNMTTRNKQMNPNAIRGK